MEARVKRFIDSALPILLLFCLFLLVLSYANNWLKGFSDAPQKNVTLQQTAATTGDELSLTLQPPMATEQIQGRGQSLALEFFNRSKQSIDLRPLEIEPHACFHLDDVLPAGASLQPHETKVAYVSLSFPESKPAEACLGQHPLSLAYSWTVYEKGGRPRSVKRLVLTSPVTISTEYLHRKERFVRIGKLVLMPVLLAGVTVLFQRQQSQRDREQSRQALTNEVWKVIYPTFFGMVKAHYMPISRSMVTARENMGAPRDSKVALLSLLLLRRRIMYLLDQDGGYYFQSKRAEDLASILNNHLVVYWETLTLGRFDRLARIFGPADTQSEAEQKMRLHCQTQIDELATKVEKDHAEAFEVTGKLLDAFSAVLDFESDRPLHPKWYTEPPYVETDPKNFDIKEVATTLKLAEKDKQRLVAAFKAYRKTIPRRCRKWS